MLYSLMGVFRDGKLSGLNSCKLCGRRNTMSGRRSPSVSGLKSGVFIQLNLPKVVVESLALKTGLENSAIFSQHFLDIHT